MILERVRGIAAQIFASGKPEVKYSFNFLRPAPDFQYNSLFFASARVSKSSV